MTENKIITIVSKALKKKLILKAMLIILKNGTLLDN